MSPVGVLAVALVLYAALAFPRPSGRLWAGLGLGLAAAVGLWLIGQAVAPPTGLKASYWAGASPNGAPERSTDFAWLSDATRIDPSLELRGEDFAVHFFNDAARFNFGADVQPGRDQLPFFVRWEGWLLAPTEGERRIVVDSEGPINVWVDEVPVAGSDATLKLTAGLHALKVEYARPEARVPRLRVSWQPTPGGALETVGGAEVRWQPNDRAAPLSAALEWVGGAGLALALAAWLGLGLWRLRRGNFAQLGRAGLGLVPLLFLGYGMLLEAPAAGRATILSGLDDWLVYESSARDILLNGPLMDAAQGHAPPFYGQPLYLYFLALLHRLTGEGLFGPIVVQFAMLGLVVVGTGILARRAFGSAASLGGLAAVAALLVLLQLEPEHFKIARQLFNENLYMPLVMASLVVLVGFARRQSAPAWWQALVAGGVLGLTAISRSQFLLFVPFGLLIVWLAWRRQPWLALGKTALMAVGLVLAVFPVTARNWVVSGQLVPISSAAGASLLEFHRPPAGLLDQSALQHDALYDALHLDQQTRTVVAFARADPRGYLATLLPLGAHSVGLQGRKDPGIYWPLLVTVLAYLFSFALTGTRRLHVWPIHAFVGTHLLVLMLFEADTYGYRLVMPMYAPMIAVAAQLPLAGVRAFVRSSAGGFMRSGDAMRAARFAAAGWGALVAVALLWQAKGLVDLWPEREPALHGLGGAAAHAALTSDRSGADAIYVASVDGTPRHFGSGSLPGLRYPWFKWFDPVRSLPLPPVSDTAVYMLSELQGQSLAGDLTGCLGTGEPELAIDGALARQRCVRAAPELGVTFDGLARIDSVDVPASVVAGEALEAHLLWQPLVAHPEAQQVSLQLDDPAAGDGTLWGNGTLELYPARQWEPGEDVLSRVPVATDATAFPQAYRLTLGISPTRSGAPPAMATWQGQRTDRVPVGSVTLTPGSSAAAVLPPDMQGVEGGQLIGGGLELVGARALPSEAEIGSPLRVGLLWRVTEDEPAVSEVTLRLVRGTGEVVQETNLPFLGGRVAPGTLRAGNVVRDEEKLLISPRAPSEALALELSVNEAAVRLGSVKLTGRGHVFDTSGAPTLATFGGSMDLLSADAALAGSNVTVKLRWRAAGEMSSAYKVFVHVLDPTGQQVVAQRDAEPDNGAAPTTAWLAGELIDDSYTIALPGGTKPGAYPIEVGVYDPKTGNRLTLANGENRLLLPTPLTVK